MSMRYAEGMTDHRRRRWLASTAQGAGAIALTSLIADEAVASPASTDPGPHHRPTAKSVIFLFMSGGPSQVDTFDPKPELAKLDGADVPESLARNVPRIKRAGLRNLMASPFQFAKHGECGHDVSDLLPHTATQADDLCIVRSLHHRNPVHGPGECVMLTGTGAGDRPSLGSWVTYGLASENRDLPAFLVMNVLTSGMQYPQAAGWETSFLPSSHQGTVVDPRAGIRDVRMPNGTLESDRRRQLEMIEFLNRKHLDAVGPHSELDARLRSYEMAFRMQRTAPELFDTAAETSDTQRSYGLEQKETRDVGTACLLARRMVERGVRFVQVRVGGWDAHGNLVGNHRKLAKATDRPIAALLADLEQRGLLDETLVVWSGEFGRTPTMEGTKKGRDHSPAGYTAWLAGGGTAGGRVIGATDPLGYVAIERPIRPSDFHATILHALGLDQHGLAWEHNGRRELPTVLGGDVVHEVFA